MAFFKRRKAIISCLVLVLAIMVHTFFYSTGFLKNSFSCNLEGEENIIETATRLFSSNPKVSEQSIDLSDLSVSIESSWERNDIKYAAVSFRSDKNGKLLASMTLSSSNCEILTEFSNGE